MGRIMMQMHLVTSITHVNILTSSGTGWNVRGGSTWIKAVAMMTPLPKNLAMTKARSGIFRARTRFEITGKKAPAIYVNNSVS